MMIEGLHFAESCCVVALGIDLQGTKHPLVLVEGSTENATLTTDLLVGLRDRGLDVTRPILVVLDGSSALRKAVVDVLDHPIIARCQLHKIRNVQDKLPPACAGRWERRCALPTTPTVRCSPRRSCRLWRVSWTRLTRESPPACARDWLRPSPCCGWGCHPRWRAPSARPTPLSP